MLASVWRSRRASARKELASGTISSSMRWVVGFLTHGDLMIKPVTTAALAVLAATTSAPAQPTDVAQRFDCSAFTHILWACLPPSNARDTANAMASAFMSEAIRIGRERHMSDGKLNAAATAALQRQRGNSGNTCSRLDALVRNYGKLCDTLIGTNKFVTKSTGVSISGLE